MESKCLGLHCKHSSQSPTSFGKLVLQSILFRNDLTDATYHLAGLQQNAQPSPPSQVVAILRHGSRVAVTECGILAGAEGAPRETLTAVSTATSRISHT